MYCTDSGEPAVGSSQPESISGSNGVTQGGKPADVETAVNPQTSGTSNETSLVVKLTHVCSTEKM